ncbi:MAG: hypothetical protein LBR15_03795 [Methanobrevibacter sp.]|jgi:hypothetical protein|nr:hypothetical protein [Candidatus Methanovirga australis]
MHDITEEHFRIHFDDENIKTDLHELMHETNYLKCRINLFLISDKDYFKQLSLKKQEHRIKTKYLSLFNKLKNEETTFRDQRNGLDLLHSVYYLFEDLVKIYNKSLYNNGLYKESLKMNMNFEE